jgi:cytochrome c peroxidase
VRRRAVFVAVAFAAAVVLGKGFFLLRKRPIAIDFDRLASFSPLPRAPPVSDRPLTQAKIKLGRALFYEPKLSKNGDVACNSCHPLDRYGVEGTRLSRGSHNRETSRNTLSVYNTAGFFAYLWDGRFVSRDEQTEDVLLSPRAMAATSAGIEASLRAKPAYVDAFRLAFPTELEPVTFHNASQAIGAFEDSLFTRGPWDRFLEGERAALSDEERQGFNRFVEVGCVSCHFGASVGVTGLQKLGLVKAWPDTHDRGRYESTRKDADWMLFRVPSLRNVAMTGPYFHDGSVSSLEEAIRMMARHQLGQELDPEDVSLIQSWLKALTGEIPREAIEPGEPGASLP